MLCLFSGQLFNKYKAFINLACVLLGQERKHYYIRHKEWYQTKADESNHVKGMWHFSFSMCVYVSHLYLAAKMLPTCLQPKSYPVLPPWSFHPAPEGSSASASIMPDGQESAPGPGLQCLCAMQRYKRGTAECLPTTPGKRQGFFSLASWKDSGTW